MLANFVLWRAGRPSRFARCCRPTSPTALPSGCAMFVLRSKVTIDRPRPATTGRFGVGGPGAPTPCCASAGRRAGARSASADADGATVLALPGPRYVVVAPAAQRRRDRASGWPRAGAPGRVSTSGSGSPSAPACRSITAADAGPVRRRRRPTGTCWAASTSSKGCYTGPGDRRAHAVPRPAEGAPVRVPRRRPAARRPATRLYSGVFGDQACGTVVNAAAAPEGGTTCSPWCRSPPPRRGDLRLGAPDGPPLDGAGAALRGAGAGGTARR